MSCHRHKSFSHLWAALWIIANVIISVSAPTIAAPPPASGSAPSRGGPIANPKPGSARDAGNPAHHFDAIRSIMKIARTNGLQPSPEHCEEALDRLGQASTATNSAAPGSATQGNAVKAIEAAHLACDQLADKICGDYWDPDLGRACYALAN